MQTTVWACRSCGTSGPEETCAACGTSMAQVPESAIDDPMTYWRTYAQTQTRIRDTRLEAIERLTKQRAAAQQTIAEIDARIKKLFKGESRS